MTLKEVHKPVVTWNVILKLQQFKKRIKKNSIVIVRASNSTTFRLITVSTL